jgi:hypothetical protein
MDELANLPSFLNLKIPLPVSARMILKRYSGLLPVNAASSEIVLGWSLSIPAILNSAATLMHGKSQKYWKCS